MDDMNVLFIVCDTLRVDHLGCYGYFRDVSPFIDEVAEEGVVFEDFYGNGSPTGPAFTCMFTGLHSINHKFYEFMTPNVRQVDDLIFTMPEIMRLCGFITAAVDDLINFPCHPKHFVKGFDYYMNPSCQRMNPSSIADEINKLLIPWVRNHSKEKFFLFVHYWDPHDVYRPQYDEYNKKVKHFHHKIGDLSDLQVKEAPAGYRYVPGWGREGEILEGKRSYNVEGPKVLSIDLYDAAVAYMDRAIGEALTVFKEEGIFENTLIIITSDHGEQLGQHHAWSHNALHDSCQHIPLIMRFPKRLPKKRRIKGFAQHIDLLPTILELASIKGSVPDIDGKSLLPLLKGEKIRDHIFMEHTGFQRAIRTEEWKFIENYPPPLPDAGWIGWIDGRIDGVSVYKRPSELYNVKEDPMETINLMEKEKEKALELKQILHEWKCLHKEKKRSSGIRDKIILER